MTLGDIMWVFVVAGMVTAVGGFQLTDEQYHAMPNLFVLDDWEACAARRGHFCAGTFDLTPQTNEELFNNIRKFSSNKFHFNHSRIHRGLCLPTSCAHSQSPTLLGRFQACVDNRTRSQYGLAANLTDLQYCGIAEQKRPVDAWDQSFAYITVFVLLLNAIGTAYDVLRPRKGKPIKLLTAWSMVANWRRLTADHSDGDPRLNALVPLQGMKALTLTLVMLAHAVFVYYGTYIYNPRFLEISSYHVLSIYLQNGTSIVHTFIMISSFLLAYNLLIYAADNPKKQLSLKMLPQCLMHRIARISPVYLFVLGVATSWWALAGDGPLWKPLVADEVDHCRNIWWSQALYMNNFLEGDDRCLIHTWFLAVDMQLYVVCSVLVLVLGRWPRAATLLLPVLILASMLVNFAVVYSWQLKPMVMLMFPEFMRTQFINERSFKLLYTAPWDSLPSALIGLLVAFIYHLQQIDNYCAAQSRWIRILYRMSVPGMFAWVLGGLWIRGVTNPLVVSLYAAVDRPIFITLTAIAMYGFINQIDSLWWKFLSWRGWEILGRMSLSIFLIHWLVSVQLLALRTNTNRVSVFDIGGHWLSTIFLSYCAALPLHLLIELPAMKFLQSLTM